MTLCVVCHDAGGAETLASYVARNNLDCKLVLDGPAKSIFKRRLNRQWPTINLNEALQNCSSFLCGTSWQSDLEWQAVVQANALGKPVQSFLDHWANYRERFVRNGVEALPNKIFVGDDAARTIAEAEFPTVPVQLVPNPYHADILDEWIELERKRPGQVRSKNLRILFVSEPIGDHALKQHGDARHWGYTEFDALDYFLSNLAIFNSDIEHIGLRLHPAERPDKYDAFVSGLENRIRVNAPVSLLHDIQSSDVVVGCHSMALVVALLVGRRVISATPPAGRVFSLPHHGIESLSAKLKNG